MSLGWPAEPRAGAAVWGMPALSTHFVGASRVNRGSGNAPVR